MVKCREAAAEKERKTAKNAMSTPPAARDASRVLQFEGFTVDLDRHGLYHAGQRIHLTPKPLETLIFLIQNGGRTVAKQELMDAVWKDTAVTDGTLVQAVREIRRVLNDDMDDPRFVQTVPRHGYRFVAPVMTFPDAPDAELIAIDGPTAGSATPRRPLTVATASWAAVIAVAALAGAGWWIARQSNVRQEDHAAVVSARPLALTRLTFGERGSVKPVFSPDGKVVLYASGTLESPGLMDLFVMPASGGQASRITEGANASGDLPVFTTDGTHVVFSRYRGGDDGSRLPDLWIVPAVGGKPALFIPEASGAGFSADGKRVAYTRHSARTKTLSISAVDRLQEHREISTPGFTPRWSPDGKWIAFTTSNPEGGLGDLWIVSTSSSEKRRLTAAPQQIYGLSWTPDSRSIIFAGVGDPSCHLWRAPIAGGPAVPLTTGVGGYSAPSVSPDGRTLAFCHLRPAQDLILATPTDADSRRLTQDERHISPKFSPSGRRLASVTGWPDSVQRLHVVDLDTNLRRRVGEGSARDPSWVDDAQLAYLTTGSGTNGTDVRVVNLETGLDAARTRFPGNVSWLAVRPAGHALAVVASHARVDRILIRDLETGRDTIVAEGSKYQALRWRPDGLALAWSGPHVDADAASNGVWIVDPIASKPRRLLLDGHGPVWNRDGTILYFSRFHGAGADAGLWQLELRTGRIAKLRNWIRVPSFDLVGDRLVFAEESGWTQIYLATLVD
jgi:Tol biopolymer transport system component/DNA-binding winged helix-turn-helix (wHTH) protein